MINYILLYVIILNSALYCTTISELEARIHTLEQKDIKKELDVTFPGQYRINFYSVENDREGESLQTAARLRIRQNIDIKFSDELKSSVRFQLSHTNENVTDAHDVNDDGVLLRHAFIDYQITKSTQLKVGLVPVTEYYNDILYSKSWGYNPLSLEGFTKIDNLTLHYFLAQIEEGEEHNSSDDINHFQIDSIYQQNNFSVSLSSSVLTVNDLGNHINLSLKGQYRSKENIQINAIAMLSKSDKKILSTNNDAKGYALILEVLKKYTQVELGVLLSHASGKRDGSGFLVPMSFTKTNSYWGYTGVMTVMPQTDTGFAEDSMHISNNGFGMSTIQTKISFTPTKKVLLYGALGYFSNTKTNGRSKDVGLDSTLMGSYYFNNYLSLDLGLDFAQINDSLSGYSKGVIGGTSFNQNQGVSRNKLALFGRLQLEF